MKNLFRSPAINFVILCGLFFSAAAYAQTGPTEKCLIVSDIHFDPLYSAHGNTALRSKLERSPISGWKKIFEGSKAQMTINSSLLGQDANFGVLQSAVYNMAKRLSHPAFVIIAGDFIWHNATPADSILKIKTIRFIASLFKEHFPGIAIIPATGNNDTYGDDYALQDPKFLNDFADAWQPNLPKAAAGELKARGYYTWTKGNLKMIVFNSAPLSYWSQYPQQAATMFKWLDSTLSRDHKNVWMITHIPPGANGFDGSNFWHPDYTQTFVNEVVKYSSIIKLNIASHTHFNDFKVFYNSSGNPVSYLRIVPSICSNHGNYPSFEIAEVDTANDRVIKETNYYLNLAAASKYQGAGPIVWTDTISLPEALNLDSISANGFSGFLYRLNNDKTGQPIKDYNRFYNIGTPLNTIDSSTYKNYLRADSLKAN